MGFFDHPITPMLARALAQSAASAYAPATDFYVVARYEPLDGVTDPFNVQKPSSLEEAEARQRELGEAYGIFGPFKNAHGGLRPRDGQATVSSLQVHVTRGFEPVTIPGNEFDALFYSIQAVEKFVLPYYEQVYSPLFAQHVLDNFYNAELALMGHLPWSEYVEVNPGNTGVVRGGGGDHRYVPVFFHRGADGTLQRRPLHPASVVSAGGPAPGAVPVPKIAAGPAASGAPA